MMDMLELMQEEEELSTLNLTQQEKQEDAEKFWHWVNRKNHISTTRIQFWMISKQEQAALIQSIQQAYIHYCLRETEDFWTTKRFTRVLLEVLRRELPITPNSFQIALQSTETGYRHTHSNGGNNEYRTNN